MTARGAAVEELLRIALAALDRLECGERKAIRGQLVAYLDSSNQDGTPRSPVHLSLEPVRGGRGERGCQ